MACAWQAELANASCHQPCQRLGNGLNHPSLLRSVENLPHALREGARAAAAKKKAEGADFTSQLRAAQGHTRREWGRFPPSATMEVSSGSCQGCKAPCNLPNQTAPACYSSRSGAG